MRWPPATERGEEASRERDWEREREGERGGGRERRRKGDGGKGERERKGVRAEGVDAREAQPEHLGVTDMCAP